MKKVYIFLALLVLHVSVYASKYPQTFSVMGTPLFESSKNISKLSYIGNAQQFVKDVNLTMQNGFIVDKSNDAKDKKKYLYDLRVLQKKHDKFLHNIHKQINVCIEKNNYDEFLRLTACDMDGLLESRGLLKKSLIYYKKNRSKKKSKFLDAKIKEKKLIIATNMEFDTKVTRDSFNIKDKVDSKRKVYMYAKENSNHITMFVRNNNPYTITLHVDGYTKNLDYDKAKKTFSIKGDTTFEYVKLYKKDDLFDSYRFSFTWVKGSLDAVHDDSYLYRLPYAKDKKVRVSQGFNGAHTHKGSNAYAVDFPMKIGSKIFAARDGMIVDIKEDSVRGGYDKQFRSDGNFITIEHDDGTMATYYHLKKNGVRMNLREKVKKGDHIAYSGNTGYSSGPHLHFQVYKAVSGSKIQSIPMKFLSQSGVVTDPKVGAYYKVK